MWWACKHSVGAGHVRPAASRRRSVMGKLRAHIECAPTDYVSDKGRKLHAGRPPTKNVGADSISARARLSLFAAFPLHPQIRQHLSQYLGAHRPGERAAARRPAVGLIQADQHSDLGVVDGRNGDKARNARASLALSSFWLVPLLPPMR